MCDNKTIIIPCAGKGNRLGMGIPKALVDIDGKPLIIRQLEMLKECEDIRIIVGYKKEEVIETVKKFRKDVTFVFNDNYTNTKAGDGVYMASKNAREYIITIDGDLIIHPEDMKKIIQCPYEFVGVCKITTENPVLTTIEEGNVIGFSRSNGIYEWTGVSQIKSSKLKNKTGHIYQFIEPSLPLKYLYLRVKEIDDQNDYNNALKWVKNNFSDNITIGIVGGMGSIATVNFFERLVSNFPAEREWERPRIIIDNRCNMPSRVLAILRNERREELINSLKESIEMLIANNCDYVVLACNTSHVFLKEILSNNKTITNKILNIIDICANKISKKNIKVAFLLASEGTYSSSIYDETFNNQKIKLLKAKKDDYERIRSWIEAVKRQKITNEIKQDFISYVNKCNSNAIILGCTELPILYEKCKNKINKEIYDPLECVIDVLVEEQQKRF